MDALRDLVVPVLLCCLALAGPSPIGAPREETVHLRIMTLSTRQEQDEVLAQLESGAVFSEMARLHSTHPTAASGGYLGQIPLEHLSRPLRHLVESLEEGSPARLLDPRLGYTIVLKLDPGQARVALAEQAVAASLRELVGGRIETALQEVERAASLNPASAAVPLLQGWIGRLQGSPYRIHQATIAFGEARRLDQASVWPVIHLALIQIESGAPREAAATLAAHPASSEDPTLLAVRGEVARRLGHDREAATLLAQALQLAPDLAAARAYRGLLHLDPNELEEGRKEIRAALQNADGRSDLYLPVAGISLQTEGPNLAREPFRLEPPVIVARLGLARACRLLGQPAEALDQLRPVKPLLTGLPNRALADSTFRKWLEEMSFQAGLAYEAMDRPAEASRLYLQVLEINAEHGPSHQRLADLLFEAGSYSRSVLHAMQAETLGVPVKDSPLARLIGQADSPGPLQNPDSGAPEFRTVADQLGNSLNDYHGSGEIPLLRHLLERDDLSDQQAADLLLSLGQALLKKGRVEEALSVLDEALSRTPTAPVHWQRGIAFLRQSEVQNCIGRHHADSCLLPLRGGGLHAIRQPVLQARQSFQRYLELEPDSLEGRWLLNLASMALGEYPDEVPATHLVPPAAFESDYAIGRFPDVASRLGVDTFNLCGGSIVEDFDNDGRLDIVTSTSDPEGPLHFYRNPGGGAFQDLSASSGVDQQLGGLNSIAADYDNDGDVDVLVLRGAWLFDQGQIRNSLLRNNGDRTFSDVTRVAGLAEPAFPTQAAAWGDFDNDGDLDLYVVNEDRSEDPGAAQAFPSQLFRNNSDGTFTEIAGRAGVANYGYGKGVAAGDFDNDGDLDLYVSNTGPNRLYVNQGDGTFVDMALELGVLEPVGRSFACWFFDYDNDGWLDLFVAAYDATLESVTRDALGLPHRASRPRLYRNEGGTFTDVSREVGLDHPYLPMGANFGDLDHDGYLDIYLGTGDPSFATLMPNVMLRNDGGKRFQNVTTSGGFGHLQKGHGISFADIDNDGDQDIYHQLGGFYPGDRYRNALFQNPGHQNRFLYVKLVGTRSNRAAVGARLKVIVETRQGLREVHRAVGSVSSFGGSPLRQEIGLGKATRILRLEAWWPHSGIRQEFRDVPLDRFVQITETGKHLKVLRLPRSGAEAKKE